MTGRFSSFIRMIITNGIANTTYEIKVAMAAPAMPYIGISIRLRAILIMAVPQEVANIRKRLFSASRKYCMTMPTAVQTPAHMYIANALLAEAKDVPYKIIINGLAYKDKGVATTMPRITIIEASNNKRFLYSTKLVALALIMAGKSEAVTMAGTKIQASAIRTAAS